MKNKIMAAFAAVSISLLMQGSVTADEPRLREPVPNTHTVVKGDTLWDISASFLKNPWMWPEIWHVNAQIENPHLIYPGDVIRLVYFDGKPRLTLDTKGRIYKLSPKVRELTAEEAIETIPLDKINSFLSRSRIVSEKELKGAPYVVAGGDAHLVVGAQDEFYARGDISENYSIYGIYRQGDEYIDPVTREKLGVLAMDIGSAEVLRAGEGEVSTLEVNRSIEEVRVGDRLLREEERAVDSTFYPKPPVGDVEGLILAVEGGLTQVGKMDVVVVNRGEREQMTPGTVMAIYKRGEKVRDRLVGDLVQLPDERAGLLMIFRVFDKVSMGLILEASQGVAVNDKVRNP